MMPNTTANHPTTGLTSADAATRLATQGENVLAEPKRPTLLLRILHHMTDITSLVLIFAVVLSAYLAATSGGGWTKTVVIALIVTLNVSISMLQEGRAEKAIASLQSMTTQRVEVVRDGQRQLIDAKQLVPGDTMLLKPGNRIAADGRLLHAADLLVEEAILTGESEPVEKMVTTDPDDKLGAVCSGTSVLQGNATITVTATGMDTALGQIANMLNSTEKIQTPLAARLNALGIRLSVVAILGGIISILLATLMYGDSLAESVMIGIGLAIAAVPESLPVIVTLSLAFGVRQMAAHNAIIRQITAVETIGNITVIASDKTGTLTQNRMTVVTFVNHEGALATTADDLSVPLDERWALTSTAAITDDEHPDVGSPTELAILRLVLSRNIDPDVVATRYPEVAVAPFSSEKKSMATLHRVADGYLAVIKGAFDRLQFASNTMTTELQAQHNRFAATGLRVLAGGYQHFATDPGPNWADQLTALMPLGLVGIQDPPRAEVPAAIAEAHRAGIRTVMITGDHAQTATAIAKEIGILQHPTELVLSGAELGALSDADLSDIIDDVRVFARTSPRDKLRIVQLWQQRGEVVAMTGDGVNDAPALKAADVGVAMGITGTDVSKNAADMVLVDDNFATIIEAVRQGRTVYQNILKAVEFLVSVNFAQIFTLLAAVSIGWGAPLSAEQMLIINILADGIPGFFLSQERAEAGIMNLHPISRATSIWQNGLAKRVVVRTITYVILILSVYAIGRFGLNDNNAALGMSMLFFVLAIGSVLDMFPIKTRRPLSRATFTSNPALTRSVLGTTAALFIVGLTPALATIFGVIALPPVAWLIVMIAMVIPMLVVEGYKRVQHHSDLREWMID